MHNIAPNEPLIWLFITVIFAILAVADFKSGTPELKPLRHLSRAEKPVAFWTIVTIETFFAAYALTTFALLFTFT